MDCVGRYDTYVALAAVTSRTADGDGYTDVYSALSPASVWAWVQPATAHDMEQFFANTIQATASDLVRMRYHAGVNVKTRITVPATSVATARTLYVRGVAPPMGRPNETIVACEEVIG